MLRYFSLVGLAYVVSTLGAGLTDYLTRFELSKTTNLLISTGVGLLAAVTLGAIDLAKQGKEEKRPQASSIPGTYHSRPPRSPKAGGAGLLVGAVALLALCAGGGYAITTGVQWAADKLSDIATPPWLQKTKDPGVERLARQVSTASGPLTITVLSVRVNDEVTMVRINARNTGPDALTIPTFGNAQLTIPGATLQPDPAAGDWPDDVPAGGEATGTIVFDGVLAAGQAEIKLSFSHIFGGLKAPRNIAVTIPVN